MIQRGMKKAQCLFLFFALNGLLACSATAPTPPPTAVVGTSPMPPLIPSPTITLGVAPSITATEGLSPTAQPKIPNFGHIVIIIFENREFGAVIGNRQMPTYNRLAESNTLLTQYFAPTHPSLPNYLSLIGGDTFDIKTDCNDCFIDAPSLPDLIEASGRSWKTYQEDMPEACFLGDRYPYAQKHDPFVYFDPIRLDESRCKGHVLPLTELQVDLDAKSLPDFSFIVPNLCNSGHDCPLDVVDGWLTRMVNTLLPAIDATGEPYLLVLTWDEGQGSHSCCGLPVQAGGRVATVLVSPQAKHGFQDETPYTHYSLLKTISEAWGLDYLGHAADVNNQLIERPFEP